MVYERRMTASEETANTNQLADQAGPPQQASMTYVSCSVSQSARAVPNFGLHELLSLQVTTQGQTNPIAVTEISLTLAGTTDPGEIKAIKVFATGTADEFSTQHLFANHTGPMTGIISMTGYQSLVEGVNHFRVAVEPQRWAPWGHQIDAEVLGVTVTGNCGGRKSPRVAAPDEALTLGNACFVAALRKRGDDGVDTYRIPGLATTVNGTIIAVFDIRWDSVNDLPANIDIGCMRSTDYGNTWGTMLTVMDLDQHSDPYGNGVGDPCVLVDRETGTIWVAALWAHGPYGGVWESGPGLSPDQTGQYLLTRSDDDGLTWSPPINITAQVKVNRNWGAVLQGPGNGIQLRDGTLVFPSQYDSAPQCGGDDNYHPHSCFIYSLDHGATWRISPPANTYPPPCNEAQIVELNSGQLMLSIRNWAFVGQRAWSTYTRGTSLGDGNWSSLGYALPDPICQASFIRFTSTMDGHARDRLLFANPASAEWREKMTVRMSEDEGQTWPVARQIDALPASYSCMTILRDGTIGLLFETGAYFYESLRFVRFGVNWLAQADMDMDLDGVYDYYETINGLNNGIQDAAADKDGDRMSNLAELEANTMANDPLSVTNLPMDSVAQREIAAARNTAVSTGALAPRMQAIPRKVYKNGLEEPSNVTNKASPGVLMLLLDLAPPEEELVLIPAGTSVIGNATNVFPASEGYADELPQHSVWVSAFFMGSSEVTWSLWNEVSAWAITNDYSFDHAGAGKGPQHPVQTVGWYDIVKWCNARSEKEGLTPCYTVGGSLYRTGQGVPDCNWAATGYRLPTEAEWEKAARGGVADHRFPWSAADTIQQARANYYAAADTFPYDTGPRHGYHPAYQDGIFPYTSPVGCFAANDYGLRDMAGNVWEWCWDWYDNTYYRTSPATNPHGPVSGSARALRGGSWYGHAGTCRVALRLSSRPGNAHNFIGFRLARTAGP